MKLLERLVKWIVVDVFGACDEDEFYARYYVARGAKLLDREFPGWAEEIDVLELDISSPNKCVLGQLYDGNYIDGVQALGLDPSRGQISQYGFIRPYNHLISNEQLEDLWIEAIEDRTLESYVAGLD